MPGEGPSAGAASRPFVIVYAVAGVGVWTATASLTEYRAAGAQWAW